MTRKIILIGGMPTVGKSTIAKKLSEHYNLPWISTDQIRTVIQSVTKPESHPKLFTSENISAEDFLNQYTPQQIANMEYDQGGEVWQVSWH